MSNKFALLQPQETECTAKAFVIGQDLHPGLNCTVSILGQEDPLPDRTDYICRVFKDTGRVVIHSRKRLENIYTGGYRFGDCITESEATHISQDVDESPESYKSELDVWIDTDIAIGPIKTYTVQGRVVSVSRGKFQTAFGDELIDQGVED